MIFGTGVGSDGGELNVVGPTHLSSVDRKSFSATGATTVDGDVDADVVSLAGSASVGGRLTASELTAEGSTEVTGAVEADEVTLEGSSEVDGTLRADRLKAKGSSRFADVDAESVDASGTLTADDLVAGTVEIGGVVDAGCIDARELHVVINGGESTVETIDATTVAVECEEGGAESGRLEAERSQGRTCRSNTPPSRR